MKKYLIISDFDGTLCDSIEVFVKSFKVVARLLNLDDTYFDNDDKRNLSGTEIFNEMKVPFWKMPLVLWLGRREMLKHHEQLKLFDGVSELLSLMNTDERFVFKILTSNSREIVDKVFQREAGITFDTVGGGSLHSKAKKIKKFIRSQNIDFERVIYLGDEGRDMVAAKTAGIEAWGVTWGYNNIEVLERSGADLIFSNIDHLLDHIRSLSYQN